jgi:hypothetical protein
MERSPRDDVVEEERRRLDARLEADFAGTAVTEQARRKAEMDRERLRAEAEAESAERTRAGADRDHHQADRKELQRRLDALADDG